MAVLGIDIGGSGIKGAPVDVSTGALTEERFRVETPPPSTMDKMVAAVAEIAKRFGDTAPVGITFPGVVLGGVAKTAANVDKAWIGAPATELLGAAVGRPVTLVNDADAAGVAEMRFGAGRGRGGVVLMLTFGTGIGSAVFVDGRLLPNTELGHLELRGHEAEHRAAERAREEEDLSWSEWARRVQRYLRHVEKLFWPDLIIIGGGVSKRSEKFLPHIDIRTPIVPAAMHNDAGIIGAALIAASGD